MKKYLLTLVVLLVSVTAMAANSADPDQELWEKMAFCSDNIRDAGRKTGEPVVLSVKINPLRDQPNEEKIIVRGDERGLRLFNYCMEKMADQTIKKNTKWKGRTKESPLSPAERRALEETQKPGAAELCNAAKNYKNSLQLSKSEQLSAGSQFTYEVRSYYGAKKYSEIAEKYGGDTVYYVLRTECQ